MVFSSTFFLFAFLPVFLIVYYLTPLAWRSVPILVASYIFYAWWRLDFAALFFAVTVWNYVVYKQMVAGDAKAWLKIGIIVNLLTLAFFKYAGFGVDAMNDALQALGLRPFDGLHIILPIGISFYIFHAISFLVDIYRKDAPSPRHFWDFAAFIALFPQLVAGPILRYKDLAEQFRARPHDIDHFSEGAYRFMTGFAQKVLIADSIAPLVDILFAVDDPTMAEAWLGALAYSLQLYFDFMGYSSMAVGLGLMMGFRLIENFNHPYLSRSITEFWKRWHISLSTWLRDYLYIPLGGNRQGSGKTYRNLFVTMLLGGFWHGANWTFILWGAWHGLFLCMERALGLKNITWGVTVLSVVLGWVMFRADTVGDALDVYRGMIGLNGIAFSDQSIWQVSRESLLAFAAGAGLIYIHPRFLEFRRPVPGSPVMTTDGHHRLPVAVATCVLFIIAVTKLAATSYSPFLYFQF